MREVKEKLNPKTMQLEEETVLICPRCTAEEVLKGKRKDTVISARVMVLRKEGSAETKTKKYSLNDLCTKCVSSLMDWINRAESADHSEY